MPRTAHLFVLPHEEPGVFTDELGPPTVLGVQTEAEFFADAARSVQDFREGRRTEPVNTISFDSPEARERYLRQRR